MKWLGRRLLALLVLLVVAVLVVDWAFQMLAPFWPALVVVAGLVLVARQLFLTRRRRW